MILNEITKNNKTWINLSETKTNLDTDYLKLKTILNGYPMIESAIINKKTLLKQYKSSLIKSFQLYEKDVKSLVSPENYTYEPDTDLFLIQSKILKDYAEIKTLMIRNNLIDLNHQLIAADR